MKKDGKSIFFDDINWRSISISTKGWGLGSANGVLKRLNQELQILRINIQHRHDFLI
jgi:hypothetical protein